MLCYRCYWWHGCIGSPCERHLQLNQSESDPVISSCPMDHNLLHLWQEVVLFSSGWYPVFTWIQEQVGHEIGIVVSVVYAAFTRNWFEKAISIRIISIHEGLPESFQVGDDRFHLRTEW